MGFQEIENLLKEEQWTRTTVNTYTVNSFQALDVHLQQMDEEQKTEAKSLCDKHLAERERNSIIAMYISGSIQLERKGADDYLQLLNLIEMFMENKKWNVAELLCQKVLARNENKHALRLLSEIYEQTGREDEKYQLWERLVKVDYDEVEIVRQLGLYSSQKGNKEKAIAYYKKAIHRLIKRKDVSPIRSLFSALLELEGENFGYFMSVADQTSAVSKSTAVALLRDLESASKDDIDRQIECQKKMLSLDREDTFARENLIRSYKLKYKGHSRLRNCLEASALTSNISRDILHSIEDFETNIAFDKGTFVFQNSTNRIGRIRSIDENDVIVDFAGQASREGARLSTSMAFKSLQALPKSHIWVLKSALPREKLNKKVLEDIPWTLNTLMSSNGGKISLKEMKNELVPSILEAKEWTPWLNQAKKELMTNPLFDLSSNDVDTYLLRATPVSYEEKQLSVFRSEKDFYDKIRSLKDFFSAKGDVESDYFFEMVKFFSDMFFEENGTSRPIVVANDTIISSFLLLEELVKRQNMNFIKQPENVTFAMLYGRLEDPETCFASIKDAELKKGFIDHVVDELEDWQKILISLFPYYLTSYIPEIFRQNKKNNEFVKVYKDAVENFKERGNTLIYLLKNGDAKLWAKSGISNEQLLFTELQLLDYTNRCIDNRKDVQENRKNAKTLMGILFDEKAVLNYVEQGKEEHAQKIYSLVANVFELPGGRKIEIKHAISERYPSFRFFDEVVPIDKETVIPTGLFCTTASLEAKKKELDHIQHVELPEVAREIGMARELGDLRENSEYKYGKEKQNLLNNTLRRLSEEIDRATVITKDKVDASKIGFGVTATLFDHVHEKDVVYTIMGPWESNPNDNIINLSAPFGRALLNRQVGERFSFTLNEQVYDYTVKNLVVLDF
ncbi:MAG: transcription elongation factor GreA [Sphaerochaeta sp.]|uniref:transcription elongation factor GreA n=1 Tax=Sphaerochaeta sp. TaxID=1972642 RepID=UPI002FCB397A